jgi:hypothetical protein
MTQKQIKKEYNRKHKNKIHNHIEKNRIHKKQNTQPQ